MKRDAAFEEARKERTMPFEAEISFILDHPDMSNWLKYSLDSALDLDPILLLNELEILNTVLRRRAEALIDLHNELYFS